MRPALPLRSSRPKGENDEDSRDRRSSADPGGAEARARPSSMHRSNSSRRRTPRRRTRLCSRDARHRPHRARPRRCRAAMASICSPNCAATGPTFRCWCSRPRTTAPPSSARSTWARWASFRRPPMRACCSTRCGWCSPAASMCRPNRSRQRRLPAPPGDAGPQELGLTLRQADVLKLLVQGKPNKLICRDLQLVRRHGQSARQCHPARAQRSQPHAGRHRAGAPRRAPRSARRPRTLIARRHCSEAHVASSDRACVRGSCGARAPIRSRPCSRNGGRTTASMLAGRRRSSASSMWGTVAPRAFAAWLAAIIVNQAWRFGWCGAIAPPRRAGGSRALGSCLGGRFDRRRRALGHGRASLCSRPATPVIRRCSSSACSA